MATTTPNFGWSVPTSTDLVKDGATAIETLGDSIDASLVDLKGGTSGQVLKKNSNTDMDFVWSADSAGMTNPMTTTGDTIYSSSGSTPARLGIGSTGQVLTVAGGVPTWAAPAGGPTNWTLLNAGGTALTGAQTITVSSIDAKQLLILIDNASSASASSTITLRINGDSSANYTQFGLFANPLVNNTSSLGFTFSGQTNFQIGKMDSDASGKVAAGIFIDLAKETGTKMVDIVGVGNNNGSDNNRGFVTKGIYEASAAITSISVNSDIGNFDLGTIYVMGAN